MRSPQEAAKRGIRQAEGCYVPPLGNRTRKWTSQGPKAAVGEGFLTAALGRPLGHTWPTVRTLALVSGPDIEQ